MTPTLAPDIAVLMPVYNPTDELKVTLDSLRTQSVPFRLFLVDDGSKFETDYETLTQGMDVRIIRLPKNLGITGAMNAGLEEILKDGYPYIARIDCGDVCAAERFAKQRAYLDVNPEIAVLGSAIEFRQINESNELISKRIVVFPKTPEECRNRLFLNLPVSHPALLMRRAVFERLGGYSEAFPAAEDFDLMWRASSAGFNIANLSDILVIKEETPDSISQKRRRRQIFSRLRIQWANRNLASPLSLIGLARTTVILLAPTPVINALKGVRLK
jgi:GT2 family glycosyltransferase